MPPRKLLRVDAYEDKIGINGELMTNEQWDKAMRKLGRSGKMRLFDQLKKEVQQEVGFGGPGLAGFPRR